MLEVDMITTADLRAQTRRELADLAKNYGVPGWHGLKKDELVDEIRKVQRRLRRKANSESKKKDTAKVTAKAKKSAKASSVKATKAKETSKRVKKSPASKASSPKAKTTKRKVGSNSPNSSKPLPKLPEPKVSAKTARIRAQLRKRRETLQKNKDLSTATLVAGAAVNRGKQQQPVKEPLQDRIVLLVRDSFWLQASWEITRASVERAQSSLAERWHTATPVLRL